MINKFVAKLIEQSLDELKFKNLIIVAPLSGTKFENICKTLFSSNSVVVDFKSDATVGDVAAQFTNAEDDGIVLLKNVRGLAGEKLYFLTQILSERQLLLQLDEQSEPVKIPISSCPVIALLENSSDMSAELAKYFNFRLDISSSELPHPLIDIASEDDAVAASSGYRIYPSSNELLKTVEIYDWRDSGREPDLDADLIHIRNVVFRSDEDDDPTSEAYEGGILQVIRSYLNYLIVAYGYYDDLERDICEVLVGKDSVYKDILVDVYNKYGDTDPSSYKSASEFFNDDDCSVYYGDFEDYMNHQPLKIRREFAYRILVLFDSYQPGAYNLEPTEIDLAVPSDLKHQIVRLMESACWRLKQNSSRESSSYTDDESYDESDHNSDDCKTSEGLTASEVFSWRDSGKLPQIDEELARLDEVISRTSPDGHFAPAGGEDDVLYLVRGYIDYLIRAYNHDEDMIIWQNDALVRKDGVYRSKLTDAYNFDTGSELKQADFLGSDDCSPDVEGLFGYIREKGSPQEQWELLFRMLVLFDNLESVRSNVDLTIPPSFVSEHREITYTLLASVARKLSRQ